MLSLENIRNQILALEKLRNIVKTMKALSAANIRQYEKSVHSVAGYFRNVERGLHVVLREPDSMDLSSNPAQPPAPERIGAIIFGTDYGLCGRFNEDVADFAAAQLSSLGCGAGQRRIVALGGRLALTLEQMHQPLEDVLLLPGSAPQISFAVQAISMKIDEWQREHQVQSVYMFYNRRMPTKQSDPVGFEIWPIKLSRFAHLEEPTWPSRSLPTYTMSRQELLQHLLRQYLFVTIFRACAESQASEHASRLSAMQLAERNLDGNLDELSTQFRRERQNAITAELLDVISGYESIVRT
jgi:F-type H+-transporting ATPase subunit gamma